VAARRVGEALTERLIPARLNWARRRKSFIRTHYARSASKHPIPRGGADASWTCGPIRPRSKAAGRAGAPWRCFWVRRAPSRATFRLTKCDRAYGLARRSAREGVAIVAVGNMVWPLHSRTRSVEIGVDEITKTIEMTMICLAQLETSIARTRSNVPVLASLQRWPASQCHPIRFCISSTPFPLIEFGYAGATPCCPQRDRNNLPAQIVERDRTPCRIFSGGIVRGDGARRTKQRHAHLLFPAAFDLATDRPQGPTAIRAASGDRVF